MVWFPVEKNKLLLLSNSDLLNLFPRLRFCWVINRVLCLVRYKVFSLFAWIVTWVSFIRLVTRRMLHERLLSPLFLLNKTRKHFNSLDTESETLWCLTSCLTLSSHVMKEIEPHEVIRFVALQLLQHSLRRRILPLYFFPWKSKL